MTDITTSSTYRECDCGCGRTFPPHPYAPHKRFATAECRNRWHLQRRKEALRMLEQSEQKEQSNVL